MFIFLLIIHFSIADVLNIRPRSRNIQSNIGESRIYFQKHIHGQLRVSSRRSEIFNQFSHLLKKENNFSAVKCACICVLQFFLQFYNLLDESDLFAEVNRQRPQYNELLESFLMDQTRKHTKSILEDGEFSDEVKFPLSLKFFLF